MSSFTTTERLLALSPLTPLANFENQRPEKRLKSSENRLFRLKSAGRRVSNVSSGCWFESAQVTITNPSDVGLIPPRSSREVYWGGYERESCGWLKIY